MGRLDEALSRAQGGVVRGSDPAGAEFAPAWTLDQDSSSPKPLLDTAAADGADDNTSKRAMVSFSSKWEHRLAKAPDGDPLMIEQYRRLAASLHHAQQASGIRSVMITSAMPGDGKTLTAVNLAVVLSDSYRKRVLLVDADLRRPSIPAVVDQFEGSGLSEVLRSPREQKIALIRMSPGLTILPAGQPIANSIEALTSPRMRQILQEATEKYDWVVLDAPPAGQTTDARILTQMVDTTLFVVHAGRTQYPDVRRSLDTLGTERIFGVVLNGVEPSDARHYYYDSASVPATR